MCDDTLLYHDVQEYHDLILRITLVWVAEARVHVKETWSIEDLLKGQQRAMVIKIQSNLF